MSPVGPRWQPSSLRRLGLGAKGESLVWSTGLARVLGATFGRVELGVREGRGPVRFVRRAQSLTSLLPSVLSAYLRLPPTERYFLKPFIFHPPSLACPSGLEPSALFASVELAPPHAPRSAGC